MTRCGLLGVKATIRLRRVQDISTARPGGGMQVIDQPHPRMTQRRAAGRMYSGGAAAAFTS